MKLSCNRRSIDISSSFISYQTLVNIYFCQIANEVYNKTSVYVANLLNHTKLSLFVLHHYFIVSTVNFAILHTIRDKVSSPD